jgi:hypothetical protein
VLGVRIPGARLLLADAPASRVLAATLKGVPGGVAVLSAPAGEALQPVVDLQWTCLALAALVVVLGLLAGFLVGPSETAPTVPPGLLSAADKIARGDFAARAPALAGQLGTLCEALNKAVEAAQAAAAPSAPSAPSSLAQDVFGGAGQVDRAAEPTFELPPPRSKTALFTAAAAPALAEPAPPAEEPFAPPQKADGAALTGAAFEAAPVPPPAPPPEPVASAQELLQAAAQAEPPPAAEPSDEDRQWREVFRDFLRVRTECGEQAEGLTYERFRTKLESNRAALVAKYGCRTVRFQVYVKEGKAALKATPVK